MIIESNALPIGQLDPTDAARRHPLELTRVYIGLNTTVQVELTPVQEQARSREHRPHTGKRETRPLTALEALAQAESGSLMLLGAPGSGKSTFISHLAL